MFHGSITVEEFWSQNAIKAKVKKLSYPRENIDNIQENTILLPICFQNAMYPFDISHFANKWKRDCIFLYIVDVFAGVTKFVHFGLYRVL